MASITVVTERDLNDAAWAGLPLLCRDVTADEDDQCAGVVVNAIIDWRNA